VSPEEYSNAIKKYAAERRPIVWKELTSGKGDGRFQYPCDMDNLAGLPTDHLPLYIATSFHVIGIRLDTKIFLAHFNSHPPYEIDPVRIYDDLCHLFATVIADVGPLEVILSYVRIVDELRRRYPAIAPLLPDAPIIPDEVVDEYSSYFARGH
jgi:hypothetical protein